MKKIVSSIIGLAAFFGLAAPAFALTTYPYSPAEALENFEMTYQPQYDRINADLLSCQEKAKAWSEIAALYNFTVSWADETKTGKETQNGYGFIFYSPDNDTKTFQCSYTLEPSESSGEIERSTDVKYGVFRVQMHLRELIAAMKADKKLLPTLESVIDKDRDVSINFTLKKNANNRLTWYVRFISSIDSAKKQKPQNYRVSVSAETKQSPQFQIVKCGGNGVC